MGLGMSPDSRIRPELPPGVSCKIADSNDVETAARARQLIRNLDTGDLLKRVMTRYHQKQDK